MSETVSGASAVPLPGSTPTIHFGKRHALISAVVFLYIAGCILSFSAKEAFSLILLPAVPLVFFIQPDPRRWVLALPLAVALGYPEIDLGPFPIYVSTVLVLATYIIYLLTKSASLSPSPPLGVFGKLLLFSYLAQMASLFVTIHVHEQHTVSAVREAHKSFFPMLLTVLVIDWYARPEWYERMLKGIVISLFVLSVYGMFQFHSGGAWAAGEVSQGYEIAGRVFATIRGGANSYSGFLELTVPVTLAAVFFLQKTRWKLLCGITTLLGVLNGLYTYSRGCFIALTTACILYLMYRFRRMVWVPLLAVTAFTGFMAANAETFNRQLILITNPRAAMVEATLIHRYVAYSGYIRGIMNSPVTGVGWGARHYYAGRTSLYSFWEERYEQSIDHVREFQGLDSLVFDMFLKGGAASMASLLLLAGAVFHVARRAWRRRSENEMAVGVILAVTAFCVHQLVDNLLHWPQTGSFFWITLGMLAILGGYGKENRIAADSADTQECGRESRPEPLKE
ncbi:MAG: hypothetical protein R6V62_00640 [Candidatus Fermentibacteraceae bacterium]